jgi:hypothetical protein
MRTGATNYRREQRLSNTARRRARKAIHLSQRRLLSARLSPSASCGAHWAREADVKSRTVVAMTPSASRACQVRRSASARAVALGHPYFIFDMELTATHSAKSTYPEMGWGRVHAEPEPCPARPGNHQRSSEQFMPGQLQCNSARRTGHQLSIFLDQTTQRPRFRFPDRCR